jgi:4a-hydroxytetrahydrobiopterin dehydratase
VVLHGGATAVFRVASLREAAQLATGGCIVDDADAPAGWDLADRAGNRVCVAAARRVRPGCC